MALLSGSAELRLFGLHYAAIFAFFIFFFKNSDISL
jgi:hypothetical protein